MAARQGDLANVTGGLGADSSLDYVNSQLPRQSGSGGVVGGVLLAGVDLGTAEIVGFSDLLASPAALARSTDDAGTSAYAYGNSITYAGSGGGTAPGAGGLLDDNGSISMEMKPEAPAVTEE
jgi:hypothetical protein